MKLGSVTKLDKRNKATSKKNLKVISCWRIVTLFPFFEFTASLEEFRCRISDTWSVKLIFSLIVTFYLTKTEKRTKKSLTQRSHHCFEYRYYFGQKTLISWKKENADIRSLVTKRYIFWNYICVYLRAKFEVSSALATSFRLGEIILPPPPTSKALERPPRLGLTSFLKKFLFEQMGHFGSKNGTSP